MAWFVVKDFKSGSVFGYQIKNYLIEVEDIEQLAQLRKEPDRFLEVADKKGAVTMAASFTSETEEKLVVVTEEETEEKSEVEEEEKIIEEIGDEKIEEVEEEKPEKKLKKKIKRAKKS